MRIALTGVIAIACVFASGCGSEHRDAATNTWCGLVKQHQSVFRAKSAIDKRAMDEFLRIARAAPPAISPDALAVRSGLIHFYSGDKSWYTAKNIAAMKGHIKRLDTYLQTHCDVQIPSGNHGQAT